MLIREGEMTIGAVNLPEGKRYAETGTFEVTIEKQIAWPIWSAKALAIRKRIQKANNETR